MKLFRDPWRAVSPVRTGRVLGCVAALLTLLLVGAAVLALVTLSMDASDGHGCGQV